MQANEMQVQVLCQHGLLGCWRFVLLLPAAVGLISIFASSCLYPYRRYIRNKKASTYTGDQSMNVRMIVKKREVGKCKMNQTNKFHTICYHINAHSSQITRMKHNQIKPIDYYASIRRRTATIPSMAVPIWRLMPVSQRIKTNFAKHILM